MNMKRNIDRKLFLGRLGTSLATSPCLQRGMGLNAGGVRFHIRREKLKDFIEKQSKKGQFTF